MSAMQVPEEYPEYPNEGEDQAADADPGVVPAVSSLPVPVSSPGASEHQEIARRNGWFFVDLDNPMYQIAEETLALLPARDARAHEAIPVLTRGKKVTVAVANPDDFAKASALRPLFAGMTVRLIYANPAAIRRKIDQVYSASVEAARLAAQHEATRRRGDFDGGDLGRVTSTASSSNVQLLRLVIEQALRDKASDVHIEPVQGALEVRYRVDGKLRLLGVYPEARKDGLVTLIKVDAKMRQDNLLVPDSGVLVYDLGGGEKVDIRVETAPSAWGTSVVMRLQADIWRPLETLGFSDYNLDRFKSAIDQPYGMVLLTGPTGSGKSTTNYSALREKINPEVKIITLENPIEYKVPQGITQMSVNVDQGMTFAAGLRSILRQDPNIVLVGEIRDAETAETAVDAAMTGHMVFSTLHTNDAPGVVPRLTRMGIDPFLASSSLLCVVGQRLLRRLCNNCKVGQRLDRGRVAAAGFDADGDLPDFLFEANPEGCIECIGGFSGRVPVHEVMLLSEELRDAIAANQPESAIKAAARRAGMRTMREDGFAKVLEGVTSLTEVNAEIRRDLA
ncbi:GspE/PulE family protein [Nocardioides pakistanensis]